MYIIDIDKQSSILRLNDNDTHMTYVNWIKENNRNCRIELSKERVGLLLTDAADVLKYFGFSIDTYIDNIFAILPARSSDSPANKKLIETILINPHLAKSKCCEIAGKNPTHFTRLAQTIRECSARVANISGGRDPVRILESIRVDF